MVKANSNATRNAARSAAAAAAVSSPAQHDYELLRAANLSAALAAAEALLEQHNGLGALTRRLRDVQDRMVLPLGMDQDKVEDYLAKGDVVREHVDAAIASAALLACSLSEFLSEYRELVDYDATVTEELRVRGQQSIAPS
jgi:hypothetical protein